MRPTPRRLWASLRTTFVDQLFALREFLDDSDSNPRRRRSTTALQLEQLETRRLPTVQPLPLPLIATGAGAGDDPIVRVFDGETAEMNYSVTPFGPSITGGIRVAMADFTGDSYPDIAVVPGEGGPPQVKVLDGHTGEPISGPLASFYAFAPQVTGGVWLATGDVDGDGHSDLIASAAVGGDKVKVFSGVDGSLLASWTIPNQFSTGGARVAAADLNNDGKAEVITAAGPGTSPYVRVHNGLTGATLNGPLGGFLAYGGGFQGGVFVAAGDTTGDGTPDIVTGRGDGLAIVHVFDGTDGSLALNFTALGLGTNGVRVASAYLEMEAHAEIIVSAGPGGLPRVKAYDGAAGQPFDGPAASFLGGPAGDSGGIFVAAGNDPVGISFAQGTYGANEGDGSVVLTVNLSASSGTTITVDFATNNSSATAGSDYTTATGTLTFQPGQTSKTITVTILDDSMDEAATETFSVALSNPTGGSMLGSPNSALVNISDNDPTPTLQFAAATASYAETAGTALFTVTLSAASSLNITVNYTTADITATAGSDYSFKSGTLNFSAGQTSKNITVTITNDGTTESAETFKVTLSSPSNATLGTPNPETVTILDDDTTPTVQFAAGTASYSEGAGNALATVTLSTAVGKTVTVDYTTADISALAGSDYTTKNGTITFAIGESSKSLTVALTDDSLDENDEDFKITLSNASNATLTTPNPMTITITDNDATPTLQFTTGTIAYEEGVGNALLTVSLSAASGKTVTVDYATADGTASSASDYTSKSASLTFAPGETSKSVTVSVTNDSLDESDETFKVTLSNASNATVATPNPATVTILDNDDPPTVYLSTATLDINENAGTGLLTVTLSASSGQTVTVSAATSNGTAKAGSDYKNLDQIVTFAPGQTSQPLTLTILDDKVDEANETFKVKLSQPSNAVLGDPSAATITILDDDGVTPTVRFTAPLTATIEDMGVVTLTVGLSTTTLDTVTVDYETKNGTASEPDDYDYTYGTLEFLPGETSKTITVSVIDDSVVNEFIETFGVKLSNVTNAVLGTPNPATVLLIDDDTDPLLIALALTPIRLPSGCG